MLNIQEIAKATVRELTTPVMQAVLYNIRKKCRGYVEVDYDGAYDEMTVTISYRDGFSYSRKYTHIIPKLMYGISAKDVSKDFLDGLDADLRKKFFAKYYKN